MNIITNNSEQIFQRRSMNYSSEITEKLCEIWKTTVRNMSKMNKVKKQKKNLTDKEYNN
jgi:hypothetical protein